MGPTSAAAAPAIRCAWSLSIADAGDRLPQLLLGPRYQDYPRAGPGKLFRERRAEPLASARDENAFSFHGHLGPL